MTSAPIIARARTLGGNCGCITCKTGGAPTSRAGWSGLRNKYGRPFGTGKNKGGGGK